MSTSGWTSDELERIGATEELEITPLAADGTARRTVPIWVVRAGDELYVRSWRGTSGGWFRARTTTLKVIPRENEVRS